MDEFVRNKLTEWGFRDWIERFKDEGIDKESLECLEEQDINDLIPKVGPRAKIRKLMKRQRDLEEATDCAEPSTSDSRDKGKRKSDPQGQFCREQPPTKRRHASNESLDRSVCYDLDLTEDKILSNVKNIMKCVGNKLQKEDNTNFNAFLKTKINELEHSKRELVGVFGRTGAGKSSLINTIIGEFNLLPSGSVKACTSVMIKVEANTTNLKYEAEIEFITREEWKDELWSLNNILKKDTENNDDDDYHDISDKLSAVYGEDWKDIPPENLMDKKYFKEIKEFLRNESKTLAFESAEELSEDLVKYTKTSDEGVRMYWPLVKCVTVRVPNNPLLQHVTLVDLPGCGDRNKSRDKMWKEVLRSCSTVWIVTEINRAAAEREAWEILESTCSLIGNGGECQQIHFICTKSDLSENWKNENMEAKKQVLKEFNKQNYIREHFSDECFKVFTVSSKEFKDSKKLQPDETEIPKLQKFLQNLNDCHSETLNYVSGAYGILSLMQGARHRDTADVKTKVCSQVEEKLHHELYKIRQTMDNTYETFGKRLTEGVEKSENSCEQTLRSVLHPKQSGSSFHRTLKCVVENSGVHKPKKGKLINLNEKLSLLLNRSIDVEFRNIFPNEGRPFNGVISEFSLDTENLTENHKAVELQLIFLKTEVEKTKTRLHKIICEDKKTVYSSLVETVEKAMQDGYEEAAEFTKEGTLNNMRETLKKHLRDSKNIMFKKAKDVMIQNLKELMDKIMEELEKTLNKSIELSLKTDNQLMPDFSAELDQVKQHYRELKEM